VNVDIIGYRDWARKLHYYVKSALPDHEINWRENANVPPMLDGMAFLVGWSEIVPPEFYEGRRVLVLHPSPLPRYRGGSPIQHQIIDGEMTSAVSIFRLDAEHPGVDSGPLCWQQGYSLEGSLAEILGRIAAVGAIGVAACIEAATVDSLVFWEQPTLAGDFSKMRRRTPEESEISRDEIADKSALYLHNKVRALADPYPNAFIVAGDGKRLYITDTHLGKDE
jgi:methionyl-tRNA formyltransferase